MYQLKFYPEIFLTLQEIINSILSVKKLITSLLFILKTTSPDKELNTVAIAGLTGEITDEFDTLLNNLSCMPYIRTCFLVYSLILANEAVDFKIHTFNLVKIVIRRIKAKYANLSPNAGILLRLFFKNT